MYKEYFGFTDLPFSIAPDPHYLYLSAQHKEALAHLQYGIGDQGGFVLLTGEVGTGKTTICRTLLEQLPENCEIAYIINPKQSAEELLRSVCDEFGVYYFWEEQGINYLVDLINEHLLALHAQGKNAVLLIDEAQNLSIDVLEQLRLLTNLETNQKKLLQLILLGQPELNDILSQPQLRQLAQRITARYHLRAFDLAETSAYIHHRLHVAGYRGAPFSAEAIKMIHRRSKGIPRLVNVICDRCLLGLYSANSYVVDAAICKQAIAEVAGVDNRFKQLLSQSGPWLAAAVLLVVVGAAIMFRPAVAPGDSVLAGSDTPEPGAMQAAPSNNVSDDGVDERAILLRRLAPRDTLPDNVGAGALCEQLSTKSIQCMRGSGALASVQALGSKVLVKLATDNKLYAGASGNQQWALVRARKGHAIEVEFADGHSLTTTTEALARAWPEKYEWLWQRPVFYRSDVSLGETDEFVQWLSASLTAFSSATESGDNDSADAGAIASQQDLQLLNKSSYLLRADQASLAVVDTHLLRQIVALKRQLLIDAPGIPPELVHALQSSQLSSPGAQIAQLRAKRER